MLDHYGLKATNSRLSGAAILYRQYTNHDYLAGIWRQSLLVDLLWKRQLNSLLPFVGPQVPTSYRAPSWSWASIDANLDYLTNHVLDPDFQPIATVVEARINLKTPLAPFEEVVGECSSCQPLCFRRAVLRVVNSLSGSGWMGGPRHRTRPNFQKTRAMGRRRYGVRI